mgnify:FL=1
MNQSKGLSALSYLSFYFAPSILPFIIYVVSKDDFVREHSKKAFITQLIPIAFGVLYIIYFFISLFLTHETLAIQDFFVSSHFIALVALLIIFSITGIWNLVKAIKVLR